MEYALSELFTLQMGKTPSRNNSNYWKKTDNSWISIADLTNSGKYISKTKESISDAAIVESGIKKIPADTVIMSFKLSLGKVAITKKEMYSNEAIMAFVDKNVVKIIPEYMYYLLSAKDWSVGTNKAVMGITLNKATLSDTKVSLHDYIQQVEIVNVLNKVDSCVELRKQQLVKLDELIKARFVEMFGDLANPACSWKKEKIVNICADQDDIKCGPFGTQLSKDEYQSTGVAVWEIPQINSNFLLKPTHFITAEKALQLESYSIIPGDIAMSRKGNVGRCAVFPENLKNGIIHSDVLRIRIDKKRAVPTFMMHQLHNSNFIKHQIELVSSGAIMAGINVTKLKEIEVHLPPLTLQNDFAAFVERVDQQKQTIQQSLEKLELMKKALMQEYFG